MTATEPPVTDVLTERVSVLPPLLAIVGPTAAGKTAFSLRLAIALDGEIISADSRLLYQGMDIGTDKPSAVERGRVPHHLIDICAPDEILTLAEYQSRAYAAIDDIQARGRLPILVGGTGQYIWAVLQGWRVPAVAPQPRLRKALANIGSSELARWLRLLDPDAEANIDPRNVRRVIRALEVTLVTGYPISQLQRKIPPPYRVKIIGLWRPRDLLHRRIDARVEQMMADGLLTEVMNLRAQGYDRVLPAMSGLGYRQLLAYLDGEMTLEEAIERVKFETHRLVRQQSTWFRLDDPQIEWLDADQPSILTEMVQLVQAWLRNATPGREH